MQKKKNRIKLLEQKHARISRKKKKRKAVRNYFKNKKKKSRYVRLRTTQRYQRHDVKVPELFSLISNRNEVLKFFNSCKKLTYSTYTHVRFDFTNVKDISHGAITILLSICGYLADQSLKIECTYPTNFSAKAIFEESGFLKYFKSNYKNNISDNAILQKGMQETESELTAVQVRKAMKTVWGTNYKNTRLQGMLIEMMANAINHAYVKNQKGWYFALQHLSGENKVRFCFVDNGKGILNSIRLKFLSTIVKLLGLADDGEILLNAFDGKFGSRTELAFRGRGLPLIKKNQTDNCIKNLKVISNNVFLEMDTNTITILEEPFEGTFYYWELDQSCKLWTLK